jgi:hypothetical protein
MFIPDGQEVYDLVKKILKKDVYVRKHTPDFCDDERINSLWVWVMENTERLYDPSKGTLEAFIVASRLRVIDVYRKEKGSRYYVQYQFPLLKQGYYENTIPDYKHVPLSFEDKEYMNKTLSRMSEDSSWILVNGFTDVDDEALAEHLGTNKVSLHSRRTLAKKKYKEIIEKDKYGY